MFVYLYTHTASVFNIMSVFDIMSVFNNMFLFKSASAMLIVHSSLRASALETDRPMLLNTNMLSHMNRLSITKMESNTNVMYILEF